MNDLITREGARAAAAMHRAEKSTTPPAPPASLVAAFITALAGRGWTNAVELSAATGIEDRTLRLLAAHSEGRVISGQRGYKLTAEATPAELDKAEAWLRSQAAKMIQRAVEIRIARNKSTPSTTSTPSTAST